MKTSLESYFPIIRSKEEIRFIIHEHTRLKELFQSWPSKYQEEFLNFCSGQRGVKILYAAKTIMPAEQIAAVYLRSVLLNQLLLNSAASIM